MPIELITGLPGHGKTLYTIATYKKVSEAEGRPIFYHGIKGLTLPWQQHDPMKWKDLPPNAIMIIDEAQKVFPLRGRGAPDEWIQDLSVHRHGGIDMVLITQGPMLIDSFVRQLCDRHRHIVRMFGTQNATIHEYPNGVRDLVLKSRGTDSIKHQWRYPKEAFEWYQSAELHTVKRRIPMRVWVLAASLIAGPTLGFIAVKRMLPKDEKQLAAEQAARTPTKPMAAQFGSTPAGQSGYQRNGPLGVQAYLEMHKPRVAGLAYTAAVYDEVTKPVDAPFPAACVAAGERCRCYSQQATALEVPQELCVQIVAGGYFQAWASKAKAATPGELAKLAPVVASTGTPGPAPMWGMGTGDRMLAGPGAAPTQPAADAGPPGRPGVKR